MNKAPNLIVSASGVETESVVNVSEEHSIITSTLGQFLS